MSQCLFCLEECRLAPRGGGAVCHCSAVAHPRCLARYLWTNHDSSRCPVCCSRLSETTLVLAYESACSILARQLGPTHQTTLRNLLTLAGKYAAVGLQGRAASVLLSVRRGIAEGDATTSRLCRLGRARFFLARGDTNLALKSSGMLVCHYQEAPPSDTVAKRCEVEALCVRGECLLALGERLEARSCFLKGMLLALGLPNFYSNLDLLASMLDLIARSFIEDGQTANAAQVLRVLSNVLAKTERDTCAIAIAKMNAAAFECSHGMTREDTAENLRFSIRILRGRSRDPRAPLHLARGVAALAAIVQPARRLRRKTRIEEVPTT